MIRNLKALGLALVALFALGAMTASAASAQTNAMLTTSDGTSKTLLGTLTGAFGSGSNAFTAFEEKIECKNATFTGHKINTTPHQPVPHGAIVGTITPHYSECFVNGLPMTIDMNGCDYEIKNGETGKTEGEYVGSGSVVCPEGKEVQATVFSSSSHALRLCTISTSNSGTQGVKVTSEKGDINVVGTLIGLHSKRSGLCGSATDANGKLDFDVTIEASDGSEIAISH